MIKTKTILDQIGEPNLSLYKVKVITISSMTMVIKCIKKDASW